MIKKIIENNKYMKILNMINTKKQSRIHQLKHDIEETKTRPKEENDKTMITVHYTNIRFLNHLRQGKTVLNVGCGKLPYIITTEIEFALSQMKSRRNHLDMKEL